ncbi:MAG: UbiD family decarboxylase [Bdellovibrionales bacterium]|nr:UbiD family decarboxylase [Bdellovibrionales bacterium]
MGAHTGFTDIQSYLSALRSGGELLEVEAAVSSDLEIAEIHRRVIEAGGPALLFKNVSGSPFPVATNLFGTQSRVDLAFGRDACSLVAELAKFPEELMPPTPGNLWAKRSTLLRLARVGTKTSASGSCMEVIESPPKLTQLPALKTWVEDGGPFITLPLVYTEHPETGIPNLGMYRIQIFSDDTTGLHMQIGKGGGFHLAAAAEKNQPLPVAISVGGPPAAIVSAIAPLPENVPELLLCSLLLGRKVRMASHEKSGVPILADAEFVLAGTVTPGEMHPEGPFGDHYGYYSLKHDYPLFRCNALFRKRNPIFPATVVGKPRQEDFFIGDYLQELLSPLFPLVMPAVRDLWSYGETGFHSLAAAVVKDRYKREAMVSAFRILGEGQLALTKFLLVLDKQMDLRDFPAVLEHVLARADFRTDLYIFSNLSMDTLDYTGPTVNEGSKGVLLGMGDPIRELPRAFSHDLPRFVNSASVFCGGCLAVSGPGFKDEPDLPERIAKSAVFREWPLIVLCDSAQEATESASKFLWTTFTRFEPAADISARANILHRFHPSLEAPIVIDARMKPGYPDELFCDEETSKLVDSRWKSYFPDKDPLK